MFYSHYFKIEVADLHCSGRFPGGIALAASLAMLSPGSNAHAPAASLSVQKPSANPIGVAASISIRIRSVRVSLHLF